MHANAIVTDHGDAPTYLAPARELLKHGRFDSGIPVGQPEFLRTPGYPVFIATLYRIFGQTNTAVLLAQVVLGAVTVYLVYLLAARMWSVPVGLLAALFTVLEPLQNAISATLLTETLTALLLVLAALVGFVAFTDDAPRFELWAVLGVGARGRDPRAPGAVLLPAVRRGARWSSTACGAITPGARSAMLVAFLVPLVVLVGGWQLRNHERVGSWRVSGIESKNLYKFRAAGVVADTNGISFHRARLQLSRELGGLDGQRQGPYYGRMYREAMHILAAHPAATISGAVRGLGSELFSVREKFFEYLRLRRRRASSRSPRPRVARGVLRGLRVRDGAHRPAAAGAARARVRRRHRVLRAARVGRPRGVRRPRRAVPRPDRADPDPLRGRGRAHVVHGGARAARRA